VDLLKPSSTLLIAVAVSFALVGAAYKLYQQYPQAIFLCAVGPVIAAIPALRLWAQIRFHGMDIFLKPQRANEVIIMHHTAAGVVRPVEAVEGFEGNLKVKGILGRFTNPLKTHYVLFGRRIVYTRQGVCHTIPPKYAAAANALARQGFRSLGHAIVGHYGPELEGLPEGRLKEEARKVLVDEGILPEEAEEK
jgi:hypothetical protein